MPHKSLIKTTCAFSRQRRFCTLNLPSASVFPNPNQRNLYDKPTWSCKSYSLACSVQVAWRVDMAGRNKLRSTKSFVKYHYSSFSCEEPLRVKQVFGAAIAAIKLAFGRGPHVHMSATPRLKQLCPNRWTPLNFL